MQTFLSDKLSQTSQNTANASETTTIYPTDMTLPYSVQSFPIELVDVDPFDEGGEQVRTRNESASDGGKTYESRGKRFVLATFDDMNEVCFAY